MVHVVAEEGLQLHVCAISVAIFEAWAAMGDCVGVATCGVCHSYQPSGLGHDQLIWRLNVCIHRQITECAFAFGCWSLSLIVGVVVFVASKPMV